MEKLCQKIASISFHAEIWQVVVSCNFFWWTSADCSMLSEYCNGSLAAKATAGVGKGPGKAAAKDMKDYSSICDQLLPSKTVLALPLHLRRTRSPTFWVLFRLISSRPLSPRALVFLWVILRFFQASVLAVALSSLVDRALGRPKTMLRESYLRSAIVYIACGLTEEDKTGRHAASSNEIFKMPNGVPDLLQLLLAAGQMNVLCSQASLIRNAYVTLVTFWTQS